MRASASAASLMGPHYRNDFIGMDLGAGCSVAICETPRKSPRILITRAYSEESQDGSSPLLRKSFNSNTNLPPCESTSYIKICGVVHLAQSHLQFRNNIAIRKLKKKKLPQKSFLIYLMLYTYIWSVYCAYRKWVTKIYYPRKIQNYEFYRKISKDHPTIYQYIINFYLKYLSIKHMCGIYWWLIIFSNSCCTYSFFFSL